MKLTDKESAAKLLFLKRNQHFLSRTARALNFTTVWMREIYWEFKPSRNHVVERFMIGRGAPGFEEVRALMVAEVTATTEALARAAAVAAELAE